MSKYKACVVRRKIQRGGAKPAKYERWDGVEADSFDELLKKLAEYSEPERIAIFKKPGT